MYIFFNITLKHNGMSSTKVIAIACLRFSFLVYALFYKHCVNGMTNAEK